MREKLIPFDYEVARQHPERVRWAFGKQPDYTYTNSPVCLIALVEDGATHNYDAQHFDRLALVAEPKTKRYLLAGSRVRPVEPTLVPASRTEGYCPHGGVRGVTYDKATGYITVTYDE